MFDFKNSKKEVIEILNSKTEIINKEVIPQSISDFTFDNGIRTWVGALFVDMRESSEYFKNNKPDIVARVLRAYYTEIIGILEKNPKVREIGIRGDCVYAIYSCPLQSDLNDMFDDAVVINSFNGMFQKILEQNKYPVFSIGIGLGAGLDLVIKAGKKYSGYNDYVWIGKAVIDASNLSGYGNSRYGRPIYMSSIFYDNIKDFYANKELNIKNSNLLNREYKNYETVYSGDVVKSVYNDWVNSGMKD